MSNPTKELNLCAETIPKAFAKNLKRNAYSFMTSPENVTIPQAQREIAASLMSKRGNRERLKLLPTGTAKNTKRGSQSTLKDLQKKEKIREEIKGGRRGANKESKTEDSKGRRKKRRTKEMTANT